MANLKISQLPDAVQPLQGSDLIPVVQTSVAGPETRKTTVASLANNALVTSSDGSITVTQIGQTFDLSRSFYTESTVVSSRDSTGALGPSNNIYVKVIEMLGVDTKRSCAFDFFTIGQANKRTAYGTILLDTYGNVANFFAVAYRGKGLGSNPLKPSDFKLLYKGDYKYELWVNIVYNDENISIGFRSIDYATSYIINSGRTDVNGFILASSWPPANLGMWVCEDL